MASLIPQDEMTELKDASVVAEVAKIAAAVHEEESVAAAINQAANSGQHSIMYSRVMSDAIIQKLAAKGYKVRPNGHAADSSKSWIIEGF